MAATKSGSRGRRKGSQTTLGDILYAGKAKLSPPEEEWVGLVQSIAVGDQRALHSLFERTHRLVFTIAMRLTNSRETAEEITLDVFHDVWRRASSYRPENGSVIGWIMNQARSRAIDRLRFEQRKKRAAPLDSAEAPTTATSAGADDAIEVQERHRVLREALTQLSPAERHAVETAYFSEFTYAEVAARLKLPVGTIKTQIRSALNKLRKALTGK